MKFSLRFLEEAYQEYIEAYEWYESKQDGLGERFKDKVERMILQISEHPKFYSGKNRNFREAKVESCPYDVVYKFFSRKKIIHIVAIYHQKRKPKNKYRSIK
jgi:plasmid stabilization system protein ParE